VVGVSKNSLAEVALHAKDLIADGWTQGQLKVRGGGRVVARCAIGAIDEATNNWQHCEALEDLLLEITGWGVISYWNDAPERTKQDVLDAFDEMARLAKERGL
jgi:hypothetical protein